MARKALSRLANQLVSRKQGNPACATARQTHSICMFSAELRLCSVTAHLSKEECSGAAVREGIVGRKCTCSDFSKPSSQRKRGKCSVDSKLLSPNPRHLSDRAHAQRVWFGLAGSGHPVLVSESVPGKNRSCSNEIGRESRASTGNPWPRTKTRKYSRRITTRPLEPAHIAMDSTAWPFYSVSCQIGQPFSRGGNTGCLLSLSMDGKADYSVYQGCQCCGTS